MTTTYHDFIANQSKARLAFGTMLLNWRKRNGWTQLTVCSWASSIRMPELAISYSNLSAIEQGKAGELRQRVFFQLAELNRRTAESDWGHLDDLELLRQLELGRSIGDDDCPVWGPLEFWACYTGLRSVPLPFQVERPPRVMPWRQARAISNGWRCAVWERIEREGLDMEREFADLRRRGGVPLFRVLAGGAAYSPSELAEMWLKDNRYQPDVWIEQWVAGQ
jgi:transcriptional regulator with XRE-family HTH domain